MVKIFIVVATSCGLRWVLTFRGNTLPPASGVSFKMDESVN
jgi:hypothetical protein